MKNIIPYVKERIFIILILSIVFGTLAACVMIICFAPSPQSQIQQAQEYCAAQCGWTGHNYVRTDRGTYCICGQP